MSKWMRGLRRVGRAAAISCLALAASLAAAHAQSFSITPLTNNTNTGSKASFPSMVTDSQGNLNAVWIDSVKGLQFARSSSPASGTSFGTPPAITTITGPLNAAVFPSFQPQLAVYPTQENVVEITWASPDATSTPAAPLYDIWAARSNNGGGIFVTTTTRIAGPVALFDGPRLAFDSTGTTDIVWGRNNVWIAQAQDGLAFGALTPLMAPNSPIDTGGPRVAVTSAGHIFVVWTDEANKNAAGSYCIPADQTKDPTGTFFTNTVGGNVWINETLPNPTGPVSISFTNTRNLSSTDWNLGPNSPDKRYQVGFFGCSYDNLNLYLDHVGLLHLLWSDDSPGEDVLSSRTIATYPVGSRFAGLTEFSFPFNLASVAAASPQVAVDATGNIYAVWSGGPTGGTNSQGIFFSRADVATPITDTGNKFVTAINIAPQNSIAPAFPQIAVDANSNVNIAWEQPTGKLKGDGTDVFNVFFARSTDKGNTFPTVLQVTTNPSTFCYQPPPPPEGTTPPTAPTTPDVTTCGTVQLGVDANSTPDMLWVNQASGSAVADIDFATAAFPTGSISPNSVNLSATSTTANVTITVSQNGFSGPINFSCQDADTKGSLPSWLTCTFNPPSLNPSSTTDTLTFTRAGTPKASSLRSAPPSHIMANYGRPMVASLALATFCLISITMLAFRRRRELSAAVVMRGFLVMTLALVLAAGLVSCGGGTSSPSTTGNSGSGGSGGGSTVTVHVAVMAQSGGAAAMNLGTVTVNAQ